MKTIKISIWIVLATALLTVAPIAGQTWAAAACTIAHSACYPWRIPPQNRETLLLNVVPNNALTGAIYRICLCPPAKSVELVFRFGTEDIVIGRIAVDDDGPLCRDFRFETSRRSQLVLRRTDESGTALAGCYLTTPAVP